MKCVHDENSSNICRFQLQKQLDYALKRLVRGNGSSTSSSRTGFHTALTGLLESSNLEISPKITDIVEIVKKEFHGADDKGKIDAMVGTALVCGAVVRSDNALGNATAEEIEEITKCLVACLSKSSVSSLAYNFLNELVNKVRKSTVCEI
jgi:DNA polymerase phi